MGADCYIEGVGEKKGGYFRDSYNGYNVLWRMKLSWWQDVTKMCKRSEEHGSWMPIENAKKFLKMVEERQIEPATREWMDEQHFGSDETPAKLNRYWKGRRNALIKFLKLGIKTKARMTFSL